MTVNDALSTTEHLACAATLFSVLGTFLFKEPSEADIRFLIDEEVFTELPYGTEQHLTQQGTALLRTWAGTSKGDLFEASFAAIRTDYLYLFAGVGKPLAPPWESVFFNKDHLTFSEQTLAVRNWYQRYGLEIQNKNREPDDCIGYELGFVGQLLQQAATASEHGDELQREAQLVALRSFLTEHLLSWAFAWASLVLKHARSDFYKGIALLVEGSLHTLADDLKIDANNVWQCTHVYE